MSDETQKRLHFLYASLKEAQDNIRTYDTKSQIVGIGFIFTVGMITKLHDLIPSAPQLSTSGVIFSWILMVLPVVLFASILYPSRKMAPSILRSRKNVKGLFYLNPGDVESVHSYAKLLEEMNVEQEIAYELLKVSVLRDLKRKRFLRALVVASLSLITQFFIQISAFFALL